MNKMSMSIVYMTVLILLSSTYCTTGIQGATVIYGCPALFYGLEKPPALETHERRMHDLSSPYHVSNRWRQRSYDAGNSSPSALFNNHVYCARWKESDYVNALLILFGQALPRDQNVVLHLSIKPFYVDDKNVYFMYNEHIYAVFEQRKLYD